MEERHIGSIQIEGFFRYLQEEERSENTIEKYLRDVRSFRNWNGGQQVTKERVITYKRHLAELGYKVRSINSMLAALNGFFTFIGWQDLKIKSLRFQREVFSAERKELTRTEYERLCKTADMKKNERLNLVLQTICGTGIRVSELQFITVEAVRKGEAVVSLKGKTRNVLLVRALRKKLLGYIASQKIRSGPVFVTKGGRPLSRTNIWREMKGLCADAEVEPCKVFPHNLRHLFARIFYAIDKDIAKLADILGHSSIETTRIYIITTVKEHLKRMECMRLII